MNSFLGTALGPITTYLLSAVAVCLVAGYVLFRLRSTFLLREKILRFFLGDADFSDDKLKSFSMEHRDLARFRVLHGIAAPSRQALHALLLWTEVNRLGFEDVRRVRRWINFEDANFLTAPTRNDFVWRSALAVLSLFFCALCLVASSRQSAILTMSKSGVTFVSDGTDARPIIDSWKFDARSCKTGEIPAATRSGFSSQESAAICKAISDGSLQHAVEEHIALQRKVAAIFGCSLACAWVYFIMLISTAVRAKELCQKAPIGPTRESTSSQDYNDETVESLA